MDFSLRKSWIVSNGGVGRDERERFMVVDRRRW
jgi:hypothetical protein